jgi:SAM-dependent methyltransferase
MSTSERVVCPLCGGPMDVRYDLPHIWYQRTGAPRAIVWCGPCDLGLLVPRPSPEELASFYGDSYFATYPGESREGEPGQTDSASDHPTFLDRLRVHLAWRLDWGCSPLNASALSEIIGPAPLRICDIGCGTGRLLADLKALGHHVVGVESDDDARRRTAAKGIDVLPGFAEALPEEVRGQAFDVVCLMHVLEHCLDPLQALRNARALLRSGGYLVLEVPNNDAISAARSGPCWYHCDAGRHLNFYTGKSLAKVVTSLGFGVVVCRFRGYIPAFVNNRVACEREAWKSIYAGADGSLAGKASPNSKLRQWMTLARTSFASRPRKYELVGIIARRAE